MKFLVLWHFEPSVLRQDIVKAVLAQPKYAKQLESAGKLECRYHLIGRHGGAWIYNVKSNEELGRLLAASPVYSRATYEVLPLAEREDPARVVEKRRSSWQL